MLEEIKKQVLELRERLEYYSRKYHEDDRAGDRRL